MALTHTNNTFSPVAEFHSNDNHSLLTISFWNPFNNIVDSMVMNGRMAAREHCQGIKKSFRELQEKPSKAVCFYCPDIRRWRMRHWRHVKVENAPIKRDPGQSWKFANFAKWLRQPKVTSDFRCCHLHEQILQERIQSYLHWPFLRWDRWHSNNSKAFCCHS